MIVLMLMAIALLAGLCVLAYTLAIYALPLMLGVEVARWAYASGSGLTGRAGGECCRLWSADRSLHGGAPTDFASRRRASFRRACRRCGLCTGSRHHTRGGAVRGLARDLLPDRRWRHGPVGPDATY